jgi:hypothetical protein
MLLIQQSTMNHAKATQVPIFAAGAKPGFQGWGPNFPLDPLASAAPGSRSQPTRSWTTFGVSPSRYTLTGIHTGLRMAV